MNNCISVGQLFICELQAFLLDAQQREATTAATFETDQWIETFM